MKLSGSIEILNSFERVSAVLSNMYYMERCLPFLLEWSPLEGNRVRALFRFDAGGLDPLVADVLIRVEPRGDGSIVFLFEGVVRGSEYRGRLHVNLQPGVNATIVSWEAVLELDNILEALGGEVDVEELIDNIRREAIKAFAECASR